MMLKRALLITSAVVAFVAGGFSADAQVTGGVAGHAPADRIERREVFIQHAAGPGMPVEFMAAEFGIGGKVVKGAPYTADAVTESVQSLADGNRIVHKTSSSLARDSQGRTRRDVEFAKKGTDPDVPSISLIFDPVANVSYTLQHNEKVARKMEGRGVAIHVESTSASPMRTPGPGSATDDVLVHRVGPPPGVGAAPVMIRMRGNTPGKTESLGKRTIEGVIAEGTRTVHEIPAGQIGNERAIEIVSERWYSPELQTVVMTRNVDPRAGETTYKLTNIRRGEPVPTLFEVPSDYTIKSDPIQIRRLQRDKE